MPFSSRARCRGSSSLAVGTDIVRRRLRARTRCCGLPAVRHCACAGATPADGHCNAQAAALLDVSANPTAGSCATVPSLHWKTTGSNPQTALQCPTGKATNNTEGGVAAAENQAWLPCQKIIAGGRNPTISKVFFLERKKPSKFHKRQNELPLKYHYEQFE